LFIEYFQHEFSKKEKRLQVLTSGGNVAFISWFDVNESAVESAAVIKEKYPVGGCLKTELKAFGRDGVAYMKIAPAGKWLTYIIYTKAPQTSCIQCNVGK